MPNIKNIMNINGFKKALRRFAKVGITQKWYSVNMSLSKLTGQEQACSWINRLVARLARWVSPCRRWPNTHDYGCWRSHGCETLFQTRQDEKLVQPVFYMVDTGSCMKIYSPCEETFSSCKEIYSKISGYVP